MGAIAVVGLFLTFCIAGVGRPWLGVLGYLFFAILCPQWNWRWSLPELDYQKFLAASALVGFLFSGLRYQRFGISESVATLSLVAVLALNYLSSLSTIFPEGTAIFMNIFWKIVLMTCLAAGLINTPNAVRWASILLVIAQGWNAWNINQIYFVTGMINVNDLRWNFLDNNTYSISSLPIMALAVGLLFNDIDNRVRALAGVVFSLQLHQLMLLESRGTMLGGIFLLLLAILYMKKSRLNVVLCVCGVLVGIVLAGPPVVQEFTSIFADKENQDSSAESRFYLWDAGFRLTMDYPFLGVGPWAAEKIVPVYYEGDLFGMQTKALHNLFFEMSTGAGLPAAGFYVAFFLIPLLRHWRIHRSIVELPHEFLAINLAVLCGIPAFWLASMFSSGILIESPYVLAALGISTSAVIRKSSLPCDADTELVEG
jgi:O-antigen ligase